MSGTSESALLALLVGGLVVASVLIKAALKRLRLPALVGWMALGFALGAADSWHPFLSPTAEEMFAFLATLGVIALLFRIGLDSKLDKLLAQLGPATAIGAGGIAVVGGLTFATCYLVLGLALLPSLVGAAALTATSVGIPGAVWEEREALDTREGRLFLDVAELNDVAGVALMALLFALVPELTAGGEGGPTARALLGT
ncbi:MAG: cation:proton antiporter, partial [Planctomycetota bacterium]